MKGWLVALAVVLAGCSDGGVEAPDAGEGEGTTPEATGDGGTPMNATADENMPPTAALNATVQNLVVSFKVNATDAEGDPLAWTLDADGDGTADANGTGNGSVQATVNHTFASAGAFNATLVVSDGMNETTVVTAVTTTVGPPPLPGQQATGEFYAGGMTLIGCFGDIIGVGFPEELDGIFYDSFAVDAHTVGYAYTAAVSAETAQDSPGFAFLAADRSVITSGFMSTHASGEVPDGAATGIWWTCAGGLLTATYESTPP